MIKYIQILRFVAATWVAIFHGALVEIFSGLASWIDFIINFGYAGVDIFFVISGVIMAHSTKNVIYSPRTAGAFFLIRFARIYTGWWPAMLLYFIYLRITHQLVPQINLQASFFLYFTELSGLINIAIWSLMFELYFYLIISVGLLIPKSIRHYFLKLLFMVLLLINVYLLMIRSTDNVETNWILMFYISPIVAEFFMGYFLYFYIQSHYSPSWKIWGLIAMALISLIIYFDPNFSDHLYGLASFYYWPERTVLIGGAALAIVGMALKLPSPKNKIALILSNFGNYSYAIYLLHFLVFNMIINLLPWEKFDNYHRLLIGGAAMIILLFASAAYYHWIEHPVYIFCRNKISLLLKLPQLSVSTR